MRASLLSALALSLAALAGCGIAPAAGDAVSDDRPDVPEPELPALVAVGASEHDIGYGWVGGGQPTEARLADVVATGALVITLRPASEDPFNEQQVVEDLGGTFVRYPTVAADYDDGAFRQAMYDLYDDEMDAGGPVFLHCASSNRVGASWALYHAERKGLPAEEAIERGQAAGLASLEPMVRDILGVP
jgi:protein tyrosine phosphatase (PTP) superfamily phosphohydrolase (DUF442 family)